MVLRFFLFAIIFLFISCTDFQRDNPNDPEGINYRGENLFPSSSSKPSSSSYVPSSSSRPSSSSSVAPISSSSWPSLSSSRPSSSSSVFSSSSAAPPVTATGCRANNPKDGFTCMWDGYTVGAILVPGKILKPAATTLPVGCSDIVWKYAPDTDEMTLVYGCAVLPAEGITSIGYKNYVLFAELTCDGSKQTTDCNPKKGWPSKNPTTEASGAIPSGVSIGDDDKVCANPTVVYKYDNDSKTWPTSGLVDTGIYTDVKATLNCPAYDIVAISCPPLTVEQD